VSPVDGRPMRRAGAEDVLAFIDLASGGGGSP
jgi:hypothetical protein